MTDKMDDAQVREIQRRGQDMLHRSFDLKMAEQYINDVDALCDHALELSARVRELEGALKGTKDRLICFDATGFADPPSSKEGKR